MRQSKSNAVKVTYRANKRTATIAIPQALLEAWGKPDFIEFTGEQLRTIVPKFLQGSETSQEHVSANDESVPVKPRYKYAKVDKDGNWVPDF